MLFQSGGRGHNWASQCSCGRCEIYQNCKELLKVLFTTNSELVLKYRRLIAMLAFRAVQWIRLESDIFLPVLWTTPGGKCMEYAFVKIHAPGP